MYIFRSLLVLLLCCTISWPTAGGEAPAPSLPRQLGDEAFWQLISDLSEPEGTSFGGDNFVSNEALFQVVFPALKKSVSTGGVYLGVGPEQNFSYIAALRPRIAFIIDIRRQNLLEHLMFKVLFEGARDRADFLTLLFSRRRPPEARAASPAAALFHAYDNVPPDRQLFAENLETIKRQLRRRGFKLSAEDASKIDYFYQAFFTSGPQLNFVGRPLPPGVDLPNFEQLMLQTDGEGRNWSFLASEENFRICKDLETRNLVVPVTGDFAGPRTLRAVGQYLRDRGAVVNAIYASNVEEYLFAQQDNWEKYYSNLLTLPLNSRSLLVRSASVTDLGLGTSGPGLRTIMMMDPVANLLQSFKAGKIVSHQDIVRMSQCGRADLVKFGCHP